MEDGAVTYGMVSHGSETIFKPLKVPIIMGVSIYSYG